MNIIINGKYASVYAAVHSSVWQAGIRQQPASDIYFKASCILNPTGDSPPAAVG